jgi:hypothetical protein
VDLTRGGQGAGGDFGFRRADVVHSGPFLRSGSAQISAIQNEAERGKAGMMALQPVTIPSASTTWIRF